MACYVNKARQNSPTTIQPHTITAGPPVFCQSCNLGLSLRVSTIIKTHQSIKEHRGNASDHANDREGHTEILQSQAQTSVVNLVCVITQKQLQDQVLACSNVKSRLSPHHSPLVSQGGAIQIMTYVSPEFLLVSHPRQLLLVIEYTVYRCFIGALRVSFRGLSREHYCTSSTLCECGDRRS